MIMVLIGAFPKGVVKTLIFSEYGRWASLVAGRLIENAIAGVKADQPNEPALAAAGSTLVLMPPGYCQRSQAQVDGVLLGASRPLAAYNDP